MAPGRGPDRRPRRGAGRPGGRCRCRPRARGGPPDAREPTQHRGGHRPAAGRPTAAGLHPFPGQQRRCRRGRPLRHALRRRRAELGRAVPRRRERSRAERHVRLPLAAPERAAAARLSAQELRPGLPLCGAPQHRRGPDLGPGGPGHGAGVVLRRQQRPDRPARLRPLARAGGRPRRHQRAAQLAGRLLFLRRRGPHLAARARRGASAASAARSRGSPSWRTAAST